MKLVLEERSETNLPPVFIYDDELHIHHSILAKAFDEEYVSYNILGEAWGPHWGISSIIFTAYRTREFGYKHCNHETLLREVQALLDSIDIVNDTTEATAYEIEFLQNTGKND